MGWLFGWSTKEAMVERLVRRDNSNVETDCGNGEYEE